MTSFDGFDELAEQLRVFQQQLENGERLVDDALDSAVETTAKAVERTTKKNLKAHGAIDTGNLRASYGYARVDLAHFLVGTPVEYGPHVEYGTSAHTIEATGSDPLTFKGQDGQWVSKWSVDHPGTPAQPHLRPALRDHKSTLAENIQEEIERVFDAVF